MHIPPSLPAARVVNVQSLQLAPVSTRPIIPWQKGKSVKEKLQLLLGSVQRWGSKQGEQQWHKLSTAADGTLNNRIFRLARDALSRIDPNESFLKVLPQQADVFEVRYPSSLPERLVRRRLRLLAGKARPFHTSRLRLWALALVPQIPLIPLPLPNITIYFTIWRIISNRSAAKGAEVLARSLDLLSDLQRLRLAQQLMDLEQQGLQLKAKSWAAELVTDMHRLQQKVSAELCTPQCTSSGKASSGVDNNSSSSSPEGCGCSPQQHLVELTSQQQQQQQHGLPLLTFASDSQLDLLTQPQLRFTTFLPEDAARELALIYRQPHILEHLDAVKKTCGLQS